MHESRGRRFDGSAAATGSDARASHEWSMVSHRCANAESFLQWRNDKYVHGVVYATPVRSENPAMRSMTQNIATAPIR